MRSALRLLSCAVALTASGCNAYLRYLTSTQIECPTSQIVVSNPRVEAPRRVWDATCKSGGVYECSTLTVDNKGNGQLRCEDASNRAIVVERR
jgi:hypothetical protein